MNSVITISRQFGSGGHEIGLRLSKKLNIPFYDGEILTLTAENSRFAESYLNKIDEQKPNFFNFGTASHLAISNFTMMSPNDEAFVEMTKVIKTLAKQGPCIIVGRCADYILKGESINFFVHADIKDRVERKLALEEKKRKPEEMEKYVLGKDKERAKFHEYYSHEKWADATNYHLCINTSAVGIDGAVDLMVKYVEEYGKKNILPDMEN